MTSTRRDFLGMSALGILGLASGVRSAGSRRGDGLLFVGTYTDDKRTDGVYLVRFDARSGALQLLGSANVGPNPSFLALHPNGRVLYAVNEVDKVGASASGAICAFKIGRDGSLARIGEELTHGGSPCYVSVDRRGRAVFVANYVGGNVAAFPIGADGGLGAASSVVQHRGKGPNAERQEGPHAHCIMPDPSGQFALSADLGADRVFVYRLDAGGGTLSHVDGADGTLSPGAGPRHIAFHPKLPLLYVVNELDSTITTFAFDGARGTLTPRGSVSTLPANWKGESTGADIHVASLGNVLYTSNRGHNSIAVLTIAPTTGELSAAQWIPTEGDIPRNFGLDPSERWLLVANQHSDNVVVYSRDPRSGRLTLTPHRLAVPSPVCIRFAS